MGVVILASVFIGRYSISFSDFAGLIRSTFTGENFNNPMVKVFFEVRLPRIAAAMMVGAALAIAGVAYQGMFRNPMVSPGVLGASSGAGFGAALAILLGAGYVMTSVSAFAFGMGAVFIAWIFSRFSKTNPILAMVLSGMMISSLFSSGTSFIKLIADTQNQLPAITYWLMGSLVSIKIRDVVFMLAPFLAGMIPLSVLSWRMNMLTVGDEEARSMGINTTVLRAVVVFCATLLTAGSVAISGVIGWVGLVIPHFCRMIFGYDYRRLIPASAIFGAGFLVLVDTIARVATTAEIPLGILTSFVGAPVFLYLVRSGGGRHAD